MIILLLLMMMIMMRKRRRSRTTRMRINKRIVKEKTYTHPKLREMSSQPNATVFYARLGRTVPWCYGFPFNTGLRHPQYLGVVLTLFGALPLVMSLGAIGDVMQMARRDPLGCGSRLSIVVSYLVP